MNKFVAGNGELIESKIDSADSELHLDAKRGHSEDDESVSAKRVKVNTLEKKTVEPANSPQPIVNIRLAEPTAPVSQGLLSRVVSKSAFTVAASKGGPSWLSGAATPELSTGTFGTAAPFVFGQSLPVSSSSVVGKNDSISVNGASGTTEITESNDDVSNTLDLNYIPLTGEEDETNALNITKCKLFLKSKTDPSNSSKSNNNNSTIDESAVHEKPYTSLGEGSLRVNVSREAPVTTRVIFRNSSTGKLLLNSFVSKHTIVKKLNDNNLLFSATYTAPINVNTNDSGIINSQTNDDSNNSTSSNNNPPEIRLFLIRSNLETIDKLEYIVSSAK